MMRSVLRRHSRIRGFALMVLIALCAGLLPLAAGAIEAGAPELPELPTLPETPDVPEIPEPGEDLLPELPEIPLPDFFCDPLEDLDHCIEALSYTLHTTYKQPNGELIVREHPGTIGVPMLVDADATPTPDMLIQFQIDAGRATMRSNKLPSAPAAFPVKVEAVLADPRGDSDWRVNFGFDALMANTAPASYEGTLTLTGTGREIGSVILDMRTAGAGNTVAIIGGVFKAGENGERIDPQHGRVQFTPVPVLSTFSVLAGDVLVGQSGFSLVTDRRSVALVGLESVRGPDRSTVDLTVDKTPNTMSITLTTSPTGQRTLNYSSGDRIDLINIVAREMIAGYPVQEFALRLDDMARSATIVQESATHARLQAESAIGAITVGFADGGPVLYRNEPAYAYATDTAGYDSFAFRVPGLSAAELSTADPLLLDVTLAAAVPLHVLMIDGDANVDAWVRNVPQRARLQFSATDSTISYEGSAPVGELTVEAFDPAGLSGRANTLSLLMRDIPTTLTLGFGQSGSDVLLDAGSEVLGLFEVLLTSGPDERLPAQFDGVLLRDRADKWLAFARITGLKRVSAQAGPPPILEINTNSNRVFKLDIENQVPSGKIEYTRVTLDHLVPNVALSIRDTAAGQQISYSAAQATNSLAFESNAGNRWKLDATVSNPLPATLTICQASNRDCGGSGRTANGGSVTISASEHTTLELFDCAAPLNASCVRANATKDASMTFSRVNNLRVRQMVMDAHSGDLGYSGHIYLDTDNHLMNGSFLSRDSGGGGFSANFPVNFKSNDRLGRWDAWGLSKTKTGTITCPGGTSLEARVLGLWIGVTSYLC